MRFISVNDGWDSIDGITHKDGMRSQPKAIPLTNLINEAFLINIRQKTQVNIDLQIEQGGFVAPRAPYGYQKLSDNCHQLEIDKTAAAYVRSIFELASLNVGLNEVVRRLNAENIPTPMQYATANGLSGNYEQGNGLWITRSLKKILTNITYTCVLVQGKNNTLVENTHQAIISKELFEKVQKLICRLELTASNVVSKSSASENLLKGKVICGICGGKMQRKKGSGGADWHFFTCITKNRMGAERCSGMYIREADVKTAILNQLKAESPHNTTDNDLNNCIDKPLSNITILDGKPSRVEFI